MSYPDQFPSASLLPATPPPSKNDKPESSVSSSGLYTKSYTSFSGADIRVTASMPGANGHPIFKTLGNLQTITYSIFREKFPVRGLGCIGERGRTRGTRSIAGSMVFTVFDRHVLFDIMRRHPGDPNTNNITPKDIAEMSYLMVDQIPPFDVIINFANEYGATSQMAIFGLDLASEGQVMSIQDIMTENTIQYTASHLSLMTPGGESVDKLDPVNADNDNKRTFTSILNSSSSGQMNAAIRKSRNPFL